MNANLLRGDGEDLTCGIQEGFPDEKYRVTEFLVGRQELREVGGLGRVTQQEEGMWTRNSQGVLSSLLLRHIRSVVFELKWRAGGRKDNNSSSSPMERPGKDKATGQQTTSVGLCYPPRGSIHGAGNCMTIKPRCSSLAKPINVK